MWDISADCAFPAATENEISGKDAANMVNNGVTLVVEGANMPTVPDGVGYFLATGILYGPAKAANAGGVSVSGLEMAQDSQRMQWSREEVDEQLRSIMAAIHLHVREAAIEYDRPDNYVLGANIAGFRKVADAMLDESIV
jgi:glutamate dehydrogenase (NADP+)